VLTTIGAEAVAHAEPDGYTLGLANTSNLAVAPAFLPKMPYDPVRDLAPVAMIGNSPFVLQVFPGLPAKSIAELIALAKAKPGKLSYASAGTATLAHLAGALFAKLAQVQLTHVPYRGSAQSVLDLVQGRIDISFATIPPTLALVRDGKVRALAVTGLKRNATMPDVPTLTESGVPGYDAVLWQAIVAPAKTPPAILKRLNTDVVSTLESADMPRVLMQQGIEPYPSTPEALGARIRADIQKWGDLVRSERLNGG
jgi:tripartite-type tricarboxylate transporter receptor subunit TctC